VTLIETLRAYAEKKIGNEGLLRAAVEHDGWLVPVEVYARGKDPVVAKRVVLLGEKTSMTPGQLWFFSDDERARRAAASGRLGAFAADVPGVEAFRNLEGFERLEVNPGSPKEETFFLALDERIRAFMTLWSRAIVLERAAARGALDDPETARALRAHDGYIVFGNPDDTIVTVPGQLGMANGAAVFTAPDCAQALIAKLSPETAGGLRRVTLDGGKLFSTILGAGVDGIVLNPFGPGPSRAIPLEVVKKVAEAPPQ
jgi:hypothetical protein